MQSAPHEIKDDLEEETVALPEEELAAEAEVKSKEEITAEAKVKAEEEEVAASMREIAHRAKEKAFEERASLEESIEPAASDAEVDLTSSEQREEEGSNVTGKEHNVAAESKKGAPSKQPSVIPQQPTISPRAGTLQKPTTLQQPGVPTQAVSFSSLEVELVFVLGQRSLSIEDLQSLSEGRIISLGGSDFQASVLLQGKKIAEAQLVMVDKVPSLQITKIIEG